MLKNYLEKLIISQSLSFTEAQDAMKKIIEGSDCHQVAAFLALLKSKGETANEIAGMAKTLEQYSIPVKTNHLVIDTCGTGGDGSNTVNISTGAAILTAACGVKVAKHGNRAMSSSCGSADVLEELGIALDLSPEAVEESIEKIGIGFMYAPRFQPVLKNISPIRRGLGLRTVFNLLGPLLNPARPAYQLLGVCQEDLLKLMAQALQQLGKRKALVIHGCGLDELTPLGPANGYLVTKEKIEYVTINPYELGMKPCTLQDLQGKDAPTNARLLREALSQGEGAIADALILNAGVAIYLAGQVKEYQEGVELARKAIESGQAKETLENWIAFTQDKQVQDKNNEASFRSDITVNQHHSDLQSILSRKEIQVEKLCQDQRLKVIFTPKKEETKTNFPSFKTALVQRGVSVIAEIKRSSPSLGKIASIDNPVALAQKYIEGGSVALSILTEESKFAGSLEDIKLVRKAFPHIPILRKDFLIHPVQIEESAQAGASAVLLIVSILQEKTALLLEEAYQKNLDALVEVHNEEELQIALQAGAKIIGVNNRNLKTFQVDSSTSERLISLIPSEITKVAESGLHSAQDVQRMYHLGYDAVLVGTALVQSKNPAQFISQMKEETLCVS